MARLASSTVGQSSALWLCCNIASSVCVCWCSVLDVNVCVVQASVVWAAEVRVVCVVYVCVITAEAMGVGGAVRMCVCK
jgi:hypothetical protein